MQKPLAGHLLVSDIDGTLITKDFRLLEKNIDAIKKFTDLGGEFTLASGRSYSAVLMYACQVNITCPMITYNGAAIYDMESEKIIWQLFLPDTALGILRRVLAAVPRTGAEVHSQGKIYLVKDSPEVRRHVSDEALTHEIRPLDDIPEDMPVNKILFAAPGEVLEEIREYSVNHIHENGLYLDYTSPIYFEMMPDNSNKGTALRKLAELRGFDMDKIHAIGDYVNDIEMLKTAAYSAAVSGAPDELKGLAQYITCSNDDGAVADFIHHLIKKLS